MKLSSDQVRHVATLARLELSDGDLERFSGQLSSVLENIGQLSELDTDGVEPTSHSLDLTNVFRPDQSKIRFKEGAWKQNAPSQEQDHFKVPKIIED